MKKILIIAEKPSVAKEIAHAVGSSKRVCPGNDARYGYIDGNKYIVSWCFGHLVRPFYPKEYDEKYSAWDISNLPVIPSLWKYSTEGTGYKQYQVLKTLLNSSDIDSVICATDADREGELIFRLVYNKAGCKKPVQRLWISSMEESAIKDGMKKLRPGSEYDALYHAADGRQKADWLVGLNATMYFTKRFAQADNVLNIGRVQTPTVNLIVQRQLEITNFKPKAYYMLTANTGSFRAFQKVSEKDTAESKIHKCNGKPGVITSVVTEKKKDNPPALYDLTHLQQDADKLFGFPASKTLSLVQGLYEKKLMTYPRTDSQYLTSDMENTANSIVSELSNVNDTVLLNASTLLTNYSPSLSRIINDKKVSGHHAIIPTLTGVRSNLSSLSDPELKIFRMVCIRLLAAVCVPHEYLSTKVILEVEGEHFHALGKQVLVGGWRDIASYFKNLINAKKTAVKIDETSPQELPKLNEGDKFSNVHVTGEEKFTTPPSPYTEATLLRDMQNIGRRIEDKELKAVMSKVDDNGNKKMLGTAATQGAIIDKIIRTGYITKESRVLYPTEKAYELMKIVPNEIKSPEMTAEWEKKLEQIKDGSYTEKQFLYNIEEFIKNVISTCQKDYAGKVVKSSAFQEPSDSVGICPLCGSYVSRNKFGNFSCVGWKTGCKFTLSSVIAGKRLSVNQVNTLLTKGKTRLIKGFKSKNGKSFDAYLELQKDGNVVFKFKN